MISQATAMPTTKPHSSQPVISDGIGGRLGQCFGADCVDVCHRGGLRIKGQVLTPTKRKAEFCPLSGRLWEEPGGSELANVCSLYVLTKVE